MVYEFWVCSLLLALAAAQIIADPDDAPDFDADLMVKRIGMPSQALRKYLENRLLRALNNKKETKRIVMPSQALRDYLVDRLLLKHQNRALKEG